MSYSKYYLYKKQYSTDNGVTWYDVTPAEQVPSGNPIGTYSTLSECQGGGTDYSTKYLTFVATQSGTFKLSGSSVNYSLDSGNTWVSLEKNTNSPTVTAGNKIMWKAELSPRNSTVGTFSSTGYFTVEGNAMSLLYGDNFEGKTSLSGNSNIFYRLFSGCTRLTSAQYMSLPATTLSYHCYSNMFNGCTSLTTAPQLPSASLSEECYSNMFNGCTNLTNAPILSATTLESHCYSGMFNGCTRLTTAPELPATTLASHCYRGMFSGCTSLINPPSVLPATTLKYWCYLYMFSGCNKLTSTPQFTASTLADSCCKEMFAGCTSLTTANITLSATELATNCYSGMFGDCTSLTTAPELPATTLVNGCYTNMFTNCSNLNYIKCLATDISAYQSTYYWTANLPLSGTFVKNSSMNSWTTGNDGIPSGWTVQNAT